MILDRIIEMKESEKSAFVYGNEKVTYKDLYYTLAENVKYLKDRGYKSNNIYCLMANTQMQFIICQLSLFALGVWTVPLNLTVSDSEYRNVVNKLNAVTLELPDIIYLSIIKHSTINSLEIKDSKEYGIYHMTSGSTGEPKFCIRTAYSFYKEGISFRQTFNLNEYEKIMSLCPTEHSFAFGAAFMNSIVNGAELHVVDDFKPRQILKYINNNKITMLILVPTIAKILSMTKVHDNLINLSELRIPLVGAGVVTETIYKNFNEAFGVKLLSNYGSSETGCVISRTDYDNYKSVGRAMNGVYIEVRDSDNNIITDDSIGRMYIKSDTIFEGYYNEKAEFNNNGYFATQDLVSCIEGNIYIKGRINELINVGGRKVNPNEVEKVILELDGVRDCKVFAGKRNDQSEYVKALVASESLTAKDIYKHLENSISIYKIPSKIDIVKMIERDAMGKIKKSSLN